MEILDSGTGAPRGADAPAVKPLVGALKGLYRAYQKTSIYPSGHPAVPAAIHGAAQEFELALADQRSVVIGVGHDHLALDNERLSEATGTLKALAQILHELDVAAVEFHPGLGVSELEALVYGLDRARRGGVKGTGLIELMAHDRVEHVRLRPIDYGAFRFGDGAQPERQDDAHGQSLWSDVWRTLADPQLVVGGHDLALAAERVGKQIAHNEGAGIGALRRELHRLVETVGRLDPTQRSEVRRRLASFTAALNPGLREDLLRVDAHRLSESLALIHELADVVPITNLIDALRDVDRVGGRPPDELIMLLNKLVRISRGRPEETERLDETLRKWGLSPDVLQLDPINLRAAMEEVFQRRSRMDFNPRAYQVLLDHLSRANLTGEMQPSAAKYRDPTNPLDVRTHAAEVAILLLGRTDGERYRPGLFGYVGAAADLILEHAKFAPVHDATVAARAHSALESEAEETRRAAQGFLDDFKDRGRIERILLRACDGEVFSKEALRLLSLGGTASLACALDQLDGPSVSPLLENAVLRLFRRASAEEIDQLVTERAGGGWNAVRPLLLILRQLPLAQASPPLHRLFGHEDHKVRREALVALCDVDPRSGSSLRYLRRGLGDESSRVALVALRRLGRMKGPEALELLAAYVEGQVAGHYRPSELERHRRAAEILAQRGEAGQHRLRAALAHLRGTVKPQRARLARMVAELLEAGDGTVVNAAALRAWRWSPARLVSALLPRQPRGRRKAPA